jgi:GNAT superfamily N-acetyltransferase
MTTATPVVRLATPADAEELVRLRALMLEFVVGPLGPPGAGPAPWERACADVLRRGFEDETLAAAVAEDPGDPAHLVASGVVSVLQRLPGPHLPTGRVGWVSSMVTEEAWRRRGLARRIATTLLAWCTAREVVSVGLHATEEGVPLYRELGFAFRDVHPEMTWHAPGSPV